MSDLFDDLKKKFSHDDDNKDSSSVKENFKLFGHSDEDAALVEHVAKKAQKEVDDGDDDSSDDENFVIAHRKIYDKDETDQDDKTLGKAAAFEALKKYAKGDKGKKDKTELQKHFVAMAMSESLKVWKKDNAKKGEADGKKEKVMEHAAKSAIKMLKKSEKEEKEGKGKKGKKGKKSKSDGESEDESEEKDSHSKLTGWAKKFF